MRASPELWTCAASAAADRHTIDAIGLDSAVLIERAALACVAAVLRVRAGRPVHVLCGPGNNGADGATIARTGFLVDYMRKQGDGSRENLNFKLNDVNGKVVQGVGASQTLTFRGNYYSEDSNVTYSGLRQDEYLADPVARAAL